MYIRYNAYTGTITGVFEDADWNGMLPPMNDVLHTTLDSATASELMQYPDAYYVADDGSGPALYRKANYDATSQT